MRYQPGFQEDPNQKQFMLHVSHLQEVIEEDTGNGGLVSRQELVSEQPQPELSTIPQMSNAQKIDQILPDEIGALPSSITSVK